MESADWSLESGLWSLESGALSLESGVWSLESGAWSLESGAWSLDSADIFNLTVTRCAFRQTTPQHVNFAKQIRRSDSC